MLCKSPCLPSRRLSRWFLFVRYPGMHWCTLSTKVCAACAPMPLVNHRFAARCESFPAARCKKQNDSFTHSIPFEKKSTETDTYRCWRLPDNTMDAAEKKRHSLPETRFHRLCLATDAELPGASALMRCRLSIADSPEPHPRCGAAPN